MVMNDSVFADVFNAFVFEGKKMVDPGKMYDASRFYSRVMLRELKAQYPEDEDFDATLWKNATARLCEVCGHDVILVMFCIDSVQYELPVHQMIYDTVSWEWSRRFTSSPKAVPVFTVFVYTGSEPWDAPTELSDMFSYDPSSPWWKVLPQYSVRVISIGQLTDAEKSKCAPETMAFWDAIVS